MRKMMSKFVDLILGPKKKALWKCADGRILPISDMDDKHLINALAMIYRKETDINNKKKNLEKEVKKRKLSLKKINELAEYRRKVGWQENIRPIRYPDSYPDDNYLDSYEDDDFRDNNYRNDMYKEEEEWESEYLIFD